MTKKEKQAIRLQICMLLDQHREDPTSDHLEQAKKLSKLLLEDEYEPKKGEWSIAEKYYLVNHVPVIGFNKTAKNLKRSLKDAKVMYTRLMKGQINTVGVFDEKITRLG
ncbi:hypothetical protein WD019_02975 [Fictibacillus sp. Mic-4]|uniref:hypothetical protein n=1 Tax=Fictibacillus sp. Mic-4 TaxID=3132826 RepID=UPI003CEC151F